MKKLDLRKFCINWGNAFVAAIVALFGLALLLAPDLSERIIAYGLAAVCLGIGAANITGYFVRDRYLVMMRKHLMVGLIALTVGIFIIAQPMLLATVLPTIWGCALIVGGFAKLQSAMDLMRMQFARWYLVLIAAVISLVLGAVVLSDPFSVAMALTRFIGAALLVEGIADCVMTVLMRKTIKKFYPERG